MKKTAILLILFVCCATRIVAQQSDRDVVLKVIDRIVGAHRIGFVDRAAKEVYPSVDRIPEGANVYLLSQTMDWHYSTGILDMALVRAAEFFDEESYSKFALDQVNDAFDNYRWFERRKAVYFSGPYHFLWKQSELDHFAMQSAAMLDLLRIYPDQSWDAYLERSAAHLRNGQARLADGTLVRTWPESHTLWADDLMAMAYLSRMARYNGDEAMLDDAIKQAVNFYRYLWNPSKELCYHAWYERLNRNGGAHWGRCNGWMTLGMTYILDAVPDDDSRRGELIELLTRHLLGVSRYQDPSGLWHQLLDKPDSYLESSCTAIFAYCTARAINRGWMDRRYANIALEAWNGLCREKIATDGSLKDVCVGTGIGNDLMFYYRRPVRENDTHGMGLVIEAGLEIIELKKTLE